MTTYVWRHDRLVEKTETPPQSGVFSYVPDEAPFVTVNGTPIGGRAARRAYEQKHGIRQIGNDLKRVGGQ